MTEYNFYNPLVIDTVYSHHKNLIKLVQELQELTLDLSGVTKIDSAGIACLIELKNIAKQTNCNLMIINKPPIVQNLCELYKITL